MVQFFPSQDETFNQLTTILPNAGIMPFNDLESAAELDDVYERLRPYETDSGYRCNPYIGKGNWFAAAIKRRRKAEIKASRTISLDISAALDLPVELLFEVFEFLHPIDLYSIVCSTRKLRGILLDRRASAVWKASFGRCANVIPPCPLDVSEPKWASMLFGPATCDDCGRKGAMIDFHFRRRFCQFCMDDVYVNKSNVDIGGSWSAENRDIFWKCIPPTYRDDPRFYPTIWDYEDEPRYLKRDINTMNENFSAFISDSDIPSAALVFQEFKLSAINRTFRRLEESKQVNACMEKMIGQVSFEYENKMLQLIKRHASVLLRRGHNGVDLDSATDELFEQYLSKERLKFNYRSYKKLALDALRTSEAHKANRLEKERQLLISQRKNMVNDLYIIHQKTLPASSWPNLPKEHTIFECSPFAAFIASESEQIGELPEDSIQSHLAPFLDSWMQAHESAVYSKLASTHMNLELVVNVFTCLKCNADQGRGYTPTLIGLKDLRFHFKCIVSLEFQPRFAGRASALELLDLLGIDPETATVDDLDERDARFFCLSCESSLHRGVRGRQALTWRECIFHAVEMENTDTHVTPSLALLTTEATESIKRREQPYPNPESNIWCCNHCPAHFEQATTRTKALLHARVVHHIARPRLNFDVVYDRRKVISTRKRICVGYDPPVIYRCVKCPDTINRLWQLDRLKSHLLDKHQITNPGPWDWRAVKLVEKTVGTGIRSVAKRRKSGGSIWKAFFKFCRQ